MGYSTAGPTRRGNLAKEEVKTALLQKNIAIVPVTSKLLCDILDFKGGQIRQARVNDFGNEVELVIEHPDMPIMFEGNALMKITPLLQVTYGDNGVPTRISRIEPRKGG